MANQKFLYVDADEQYHEEALSVSSSAGAGDAGKLITLNGAGQIDNSFINAASIDHGSLAGLGDDDHTQYILVDGTRAYTGPQSLGGFKITSLAQGTAGTDAVNKDQLDQAVSGLQDFRESVKDKDLLTPPGSPTTGDRYILGQPTDTTTGAWASNPGEIATWNGASWDFEAQPDEGTFVFVEDEDTAYVFNNDTFASGMWVIFNNGVLSAGDGIDISSSIVAVDLAGVDDGLKFESSQLSLDFADVSVANDRDGTNGEKAVRAEDLSANGANQGANLLGADPTSIAQSSATTVQGILEDLSASVSGAGQSYTVGTGGVTLGDLVSVTSNDTVQPLNVSASAPRPYGIGIALTTEAAAGTVTVLSNDQILDNVVTGKTAGERLFWDGSAVVSIGSIPTSSGDAIWQVGVAKNATDMQVEIRFIRINN